MDEYCVLFPDFIAELANGFKKRKAFNITHRAADFHDRYIEIGCRVPDVVFDFVGNVGDDLNRFAQVVSMSFFGNDGIINLPCGQIVFLSHAGGAESFIMPQIEIGFRAVVGHENFAVLERAHGPRVNIDVGIQFLVGNIEPAAFQ
ncbi:MAG: hypothetical protein BWX99_01664 [Deltaproteobacteria bacterium ADurb.Bin151]|nr:MAG: hypothetical protein BWX99_01664 [Deltaproteobacteria bacterium ADurb.Bin151]